MAMSLFYIRMILTRIQTIELIVFNVGISAKGIFKLIFILSSKTVRIESVRLDLHNLMNHNVILSFATFNFAFSIYLIVYLFKSLYIS